MHNLTTSWPHTSHMAGW